jgi:hypothetical protein
MARYKAKSQIERFSLGKVRDPATARNDLQRVGLEFVSGGDGELDEAPTMGQPADTTQVGWRRPVSICEGQRRVACQ